MENTLKISKIGKYWEILDEIYSKISYYFFNVLKVSKFQDHRTSGSGGEDFHKFLPCIMGGRPPWPYDLDHLY